MTCGLENSYVIGFFWLRMKEISQPSLADFGA